MEGEQLSMIFLVFIVVIISSFVYKLPSNSVSLALLIGVLASFIFTPHQEQPTSCLHKGEKLESELEKIEKRDTKKTEMDESQNNDKLENAIRQAYDSEAFKERQKQNDSQNRIADNRRLMDVDFDDDDLIYGVKGQKKRRGKTMHESIYEYNRDSADIAHYGMGTPLHKMQQELGSYGDNMLAARSIEQGRRAKQSIDNRAKYDRYSVQGFYDEELRSHANKIWWENDALEHMF